MLSVYAKILSYFLTQKCFNTLPFWGVEEIPVGSPLLKLIVLSFFYAFFEQFFSQCC